MTPQEKENLSSSEFRYRPKKWKKLDGAALYRPTSKKTILLVI